MLILFGLLSGILPAVAAFPYVRDIFRHKTKPHRASFFIWTVLGLIAFSSQFADGATWSLLLPAADTLATLVIFLLALKFGTGGFNKKDVAALTLAGIGLILWYFTQQPLFALLVTISIDTIATVLTVLKTSKEPHTETLSSWFLATLGGLCAIFAISELSFSLVIYPLYIFLANGAVCLAIVAGKRTKGARNFPDKPIL